MAKRKTNRRELSADHGVTHGRSGSSGSPKQSFRGGDLILVLMVIGLTALVIVVSAVFVPMLRNQFLEKYEDLTFTVELPSPLIRDLSDLPKEGDSWFLIDSDNAECTVTDIKISEETDICYVTLERKNACYRVGEGYTIADTRVAVGSTLYFRCDPDLYFAATVTQISSERFPSSAISPDDETSGSEEPTPETAAESEETTDPIETTELAEVTEEADTATEQETAVAMESGEEETNAETE